MHKKVLISIVIITSVVIVSLLISDGGVKKQKGVNSSDTINKEENTGNSPPTTIREAKLIAGNVSKYYEFEKESYEMALNEGKIVYLEFYANWCPICRGMEPDLKSGFNELNKENVVGFRVNYNDNETDEYEKQLAKNFGITYQHTRVVIKNGTVILTDNTSWNKDRFIKVKIQQTTWVWKNNKEI